jgi:Translation elongation factors (GTPases)
MKERQGGSLTCVRVNSGVMESGTSDTNAVKDKKERKGRRLQKDPNHREEKKEARAGDSVAMAGRKNPTTGETLGDPENPVILERMEFFDFVIEIGVEQKKKNELGEKWVWV